MIAVARCDSADKAFEKHLGEMSISEGRDVILHLTKFCQSRHKFVTTLRESFTFDLGSFINSGNDSFGGSL